jgi:CRISPR-associated protein Cas5h
MEALRFKLSGNSAFFKKPDVNQYKTFTYSNIHKVCLLGLLGAVLGLHGYAQQEVNNEALPDFYSKLQDLKVSIVPHKQKFTKHLHVFNNHTGFYNKGGSNLITKQEWLENVAWDIYILIDGSDKVNELVKTLLAGECSYIPYLGANNHRADISNVGVVTLSEYKKGVIDSLVLNNLVNSIDIDERADETFFKLKEYLPVGLDRRTNQYEQKQFVLTNGIIELSSTENVYTDSSKSLLFF